MEKHTETPWVAGSPNFQRWNNVAIWKRGKSDSFIAEVFGHDKEEGEANAAFIVRACNAHEALVRLAEHLSDFPYSLTPDQWASEAREALREVQP